MGLWGAEGWADEREPFPQGNSVSCRNEPWEGGRERGPCLLALARGKCTATAWCGAVDVSLSPGQAGGGDPSLCAAP